MPKLRLFPLTFWEMHQHRLTFSASGNTIHGNVIDECSRIEPCNDNILSVYNGFYVMAEFRYSPRDYFWEFDHFEQWVEENATSDVIFRGECSDSMNNLYSDHSTYRALSALPLKGTRVEITEERKRWISDNGLVQGKDFDMRNGYAYIRDPHTASLIAMI